MVYLKNKSATEKCIEIMSEMLFESPKEINVELKFKIDKVTEHKVKEENKSLDLVTHDI